MECLRNTNLPLLHNDKRKKIPLFINFDLNFAWLPSNQDNFDPFFFWKNAGIIHKKLHLITTYNDIQTVMLEKIP